MLIVWTHLNILATKPMLVHVEGTAPCPHNPAIQIRFSEFAFADIVCLQFETEMRMSCHTVITKYLAQNVLKRAKPGHKVRS
jgi:hypothetical protein